jgi:hypothetical protein
MVHPDGRQEANLVTAQVCCNDCWDLAKAEWKGDVICGTCGPRKVHFTGGQCIDEFGDYLYKVGYVFILNCNYYFYNFKGSCQEG